MRDREDLYEEILFSFKVGKIKDAALDPMLMEFRRQFYDILEDLPERDYFAASDMEDDLFQDVLQELDY
tara:strand:+ start:816 stop:1022 length:207 start_codon:yes stop_codon:yes gene_type:complete